MADFLDAIYKWYKYNKRNLPWREATDPYKIWISEIILQQTRVNQGKGYYLKFLKRFPTINELAKAPEGKVLKEWQGLGYYSRARNIHYSAKYILENYNGEFPAEYEHILSLKGIGEYTAAAIASIAFGKPYAAVDGNISRVLARLFEIVEPVNSAEGRKKIKSVAKEILNHHDPGMHNQALMELGALVCLPSSPLCHQCPASEACLAFSHKQTLNLPVKLRQKNQKNRFFYYFLIEQGNTAYLKQRTKNDIWKNLYELPLIETEKEESVRDILSLATKHIQPEIDKSKIISISHPVTHVLSHQKIRAVFIHISIEKDIQIKEGYIRVKKKDISKFAVPRLIEKYFESNEI